MIAIAGEVARGMILAQWLRVIIGACLVLTWAAAPAQTSADNFKKILPAIQLLLLSGEDRRGVYNIFTDHLNTPRLITNQVGQAVWRYDNNDPFGGNVPDENPSGLGTFTCNLRFTGTYADQETGMLYNWWRTLESGIGRYLQAEPLGLAGDINLYQYARNNPLTYFDPDGRQATGQTGSQTAQGKSPVPPQSQVSPQSKPAQPNTIQQIIQGNASNDICQQNAMVAGAVIGACVTGLATKSFLGAGAGFVLGGIGGILILGDLICLPDPQLPSTQPPNKK